MEKAELKERLEDLIGGFECIRRNLDKVNFEEDYEEYRKWRDAWDEGTVQLRKLMIDSYGCKELPELPKVLNTIWNNSRCSGSDMVILTLTLLLESI